MGSPELLTQLVSALGPMGFVMWLVWRTTNHTIPRLAQAFEEAIERQRTDFKAMMKEQRDDLHRFLEREQDTHMKQTDKMVKAIEELSKEVRNVRDVVTS